MKIRKSYYRLFIYIFILVLVFSPSANSVLAATSRLEKKVEIRSALEEATVNLYCRLRAGNTIYSPTGSGVFISDKGVILTNAHVAQYFLLAKKKGRVSGWCNIRTGSPADETYTAEILYISPVWLSGNITLISKSKPSGSGENDFALLYVTGVSKKKAKLPPTFPAIPLELLSTTTEGEKVTILGYPTGNRNFKQVLQKLNSVMAASSVTNIRSFTTGVADVLTLAPSDAGGYGVSGGPVVDNTGKLIGIVVSKGVGETDRTLRAITIPYIERTLLAHSGLSLNSLLSSDLNLSAQKFRSLITEDIIKELNKGFLKKK